MGIDATPAAGMLPWARDPKYLPATARIRLGLPMAACASSMCA